ncbi:SDR family NAD(P)-dependent oxidoreductase [Aquabacterium sp. CECT 9606]|uniref:SDR family NAD(P)-dependent oxidoreductase n=1 Tax=Aquabacterium sp. CECT 9606 TaxID=2845822 RepID=UPI001E5DA44C|nr:glucose 1-dehydrogenase [Aquabacterium sp. CECT 9606]CAH0354130.1 5-keto-D-gluconate 5-reductase [Aquabacterium sp. CECT 9606]
MADLFSLSGKVAIVTGGAGDLGLAIARAYLDAGATVVLVGRRLASLDAAVASLGVPERLTSISADVSDDVQIDAMVDAVMKQHGRIDILVTAAGIQHRSPVLDFDHGHWNDVIKVNLTGAFYCAQAVARHMVGRQAGRIIMITSLTSEIGIPNISAYAASRGGIRQLAKTLAVELAPHGVTVNCIGPGRFLTAMTADVFKDEAKAKRFLDVIPMRRAGQPEDLAGISVLLASDASSYITGQSFYVDGGWLAGGGNILG